MFPGMGGRQGGGFKQPMPQPMPIDGPRPVFNRGPDSLMRGRPSLNRITSDVNKGPGSMGRNEIHIARPLNIQERQTQGPINNDYKYNIGGGIPAPMMQTQGPESLQYLA